MVASRDVQTHGESPMVGGAVIAAVSGLALLPLEPITGLSLLGSGVMMMYKTDMDAKVQKMDSKARAIEDTAKQTEADLKSKLRDAHEEKDGLKRATALLEGKNAKWQLAFVAAAAVAGGAAYYMYTRRKKKAATINLGPDEVSIDHNVPVAYAPRLAAEVGDATCVCCMEHVPDVLLRPCMHVKLCWQCLLRLPTASCPSCRAVVKEVDFVFVA
eukprot:Rhum_TRINITY_DN20851_c0_g1::Rhum_TRINITY_DN20851_c0_g1_i1::g.172399::m.172399